jgi:hypothetical protein
VLIARRSGSVDQSELLQRRHTVVETDLFDDLAVHEFQNGGYESMIVPLPSGLVHSHRFRVVRR